MEITMVAESVEGMGKLNYRKPLEDIFLEQVSQGRDAEASYFARALISELYIYRQNDGGASDQIGPVAIMLCDEAATAHLDVWRKMPLTQHVLWTEICKAWLSCVEAQTEQILARFLLEHKFDLFEDRKKFGRILRTSLEDSSGKCLPKLRRLMLAAKETDCEEVYTIVAHAYVRNSSRHHLLELFQKGLKE